MTWGQEVCYASFQWTPVSALSLPTVWSHRGNPGVTRCREMATLPAGYIPQRKVPSASSSGSLGFIVCVKCCRMVDSVPRWGLSLSWPIQSDHLLIADWMIPPSGREHSHSKTQAALVSAQLDLISAQAHISLKLSYHLWKLNNRKSCYYRVFQCIRTNLKSGLR